MIWIKLYLIWENIREFFTYKLWGKKTPIEILQENDPYIYEDDE